MKNTRPLTLIINRPPGGVTGFITKLEEDFKYHSTALERWKGFPSDPVVRNVVSHLSLSVEVYEVLLQHFQNKEVKNES
jgi:hypothetical protein